MNLEHAELLTALAESQEEITVVLTNRLVAHTDTLFASVQKGEFGTDVAVSEYVQSFRKELASVKTALIRYQAAASRLGDLNLIARVVAMQGAAERLDGYAVQTLQRAYQLFYAAKRQPAL